MPETMSTVRFQLFFGFLGEKALSFFEKLGRYFLDIGWALRNLGTIRYYARNIAGQMVQIGNNSIPTVIFVSAFVGMVTSARSVVGNLVIKTVLLELTPLLTALVLAGKVGATITAELGSMRVTEQIDALESLAFDSISFLITPRVLAGTVMFPVLTVIGDFVALLGGLLGASVVTHIAPDEFISGMRDSFLVSDAVYGIIKSMFFGFAITSIACFQGYHVEGGSEGVGKSTMQTVVLSCLTVVVLDFLLASVLL
jgi:phospholipid/cholesterol/gamma-HCH transport system permease protein